MKLLMRTKTFIGVISLGRLILYRENTSSNEVEYRQTINLQGPDITVDVKSDHKNEKHFTLIIHRASKADETYEVSTSCPNIYRKQLRHCYISDTFIIFLLK